MDTSKNRELNEVTISKYRAKTRFGGPDIMSAAQTGRIAVNLSLVSTGRISSVLTPGLRTGQQEEEARN